jgi:phosphoribosylformimino-5-aminoimidazole carboxamide ribotide isomerase
MSDTPFRVIPAIDIRGGRCVRLWQGDYGRETVYGDRPEEVARRWADAGASWIHVVDLDGAASGSTDNREAIARIVAAVPIPVEVGGGIRDRRTMDDYHNLGVARVILGTVACRQPEIVASLAAGYEGEVYVGLDARDGMVAIQGWTETLSRTAHEVAAVAAASGAHGFVFTDIARDGTLEGPNLAALREFAAGTSRPVIASGGISSVDDILRVAACRELGVSGVIVGRALYVGSVDLAEAIRQAEREI